MHKEVPTVTLNLLNPTVETYGCPYEFAQHRVVQGLFQWPKKDTKIRFEMFFF